MQLELVWANGKPAVNLSTSILVLEKVTKHQPHYSTG